MTAFQTQPNVDQRAAATTELCATELDAVIGGTSWFEVLSNIFKAQNETRKSIAENIR
ncbi:MULTISPECIES: hypothetical protein [unclassified Bradyrhizobium]|uniref:hypothetical protein n=1 Tax=unclassified Bradyrhizobium TaxID=2631580 RepID=UPI001BAABA4F|nr:MULTISPECIES: hypothetical protein [unclassified Bradyrhizobium]MBR1229830.1 hypothetical protein [Bradyrhizobium sp. AUGA SZCCT0176]MBR1232282.1 hypothetical protein [Bradyrhizobium sp. AUGA SZCCT0182]MBR1281901.1 hypothetical protein [Bradyrhizobium sp. AUGA SZCCT0177]MBR1297700.1 hypothetical protein [Bradyrhizobium sp. AUGA SZCCT0042]